MIGVGGLHGALLEVRVHPDLIDRRHDARLGEQPVEALDREIAHTDRTDLAAGQQRLQRSVGGERSRS
jgi:hypothetical protein